MVHYVLGLYPCKLKEGTRADKAYNDELVYERHRHRYEFNNEYREAMEAEGLVFSGTSPDNRLVEIIEFPEKKFFIGMSIPSRVCFSSTTSTTIIP